MVKEKSSIQTFNQNLAKYLVDPIGEALNHNADAGLKNDQKANEVKKVKFSYPKNGLYGLL